MAPTTARRGRGAVAGSMRSLWVRPSTSSIPTIIMVWRSQQLGVVAVTDEQGMADLPPEIVARFGLDRLPLHQRGAGLADLLDLTGRTAVVTGGSGASLGQAISKRLARLGATVAVVEVADDQANAVVAEIDAADDGAAFAVHGDVADWDGIHRALESVHERTGRIDVLVNNAGGALRLHGPLMDAAPADIRRVVDVNLLGTIFATRAALEHMVPAGSGRIINIASEGGKIGMPNLAVYNACKAGVIGFTRNIVHEVSAHGISAVAVCPGIMVGPYTLDRFRSFDAVRRTHGARPLDAPGHPRAGVSARGGGQRRRLPRLRGGVLCARHCRERRRRHERLGPTRPFHLGADRLNWPSGRGGSRKWESPRPDRSGISMLIVVLKSWLASGTSHSPFPISSRA